MFFQRLVCCAIFFVISWFEVDRFTLPKLLHSSTARCSSIHFYFMPFLQLWKEDTYLPDTVLHRRHGISAGREAFVSLGVQGRFADINLRISEVRALFFERDRNLPSSVRIIFSGVFSQTCVRFLCQKCSGKGAMNKNLSSFWVTHHPVKIWGGNVFFWIVPAAASSDIDNISESMSTPKCNSFDHELKTTREDKENDSFLVENHTKYIGLLTICVSDLFPCMTA